jgi:hypothetical protein
MKPGAGGWHRQMLLQLWNLCAAAKRIQGTYSSTLSCTNSGFILATTSSMIW